MQYNFIAKYLNRCTALSQCVGVVGVGRERVWSVETGDGLTRLPSGFRSRNGCPFLVDFSRYANHKTTTTTIR